MLLKNALVTATGARGVGKSLFVATYAPPAEIDQVFYHDAERSGNRAVQEMEELGLSFGYYDDLQARFGDLPSDKDLLHRIAQGDLPWVNEKQKSSLEAYYLYVLERLDTLLVQDRYKVYIHDPIEKLEAGMTAWTEAHKKQAGWTDRAYGKMWSEGVYPLYEQFIQSVFGRGVETILFATHLRTPWEGKRPVPNKVEPTGKKVLYKLSSLMVWLVNDRSNADGAPGGIVLKERLHRMKVVEGRWKPSRMIPERIPHCTWVDIENYLEHGCDLSSPAPGEQMTRAEREMTSEFFTDEQMRLMVLDAEKELELAKQATAQYNGHAPPDIPSPQVRAEMQKAQEMGLTEANRGEIQTALVGQFPPPLQASGVAERTVIEAIKRLLT